MNLHDLYLGPARAWAVTFRAFALASVARNWSSASRPVGAQLTIEADERFQGSVSGEFLESVGFLGAGFAIRRRQKNEAIHEHAQTGGSLHS